MRARTSRTLRWYHVDRSKPNHHALQVHNDILPLHRAVNSRSYATHKVEDMALFDKLTPRTLSTARTHSEPPPGYSNTTWRVSAVVWCEDVDTELKSQCVSLLEKLYSSILQSEAWDAQNCQLRLEVLVLTSLEHSPVESSDGSPPQGLGERLRALSERSWTSNIILREEIVAQQKELSFAEMANLAAVHARGGEMCALSLRGLGV